MCFSIITVNRNNANGLEETIKSVIVQNKCSYEFIIIDGASTDTSLDVVNKYKEYISYFVSEPDNGIYHAMNKGIAKAQGEYVIFMNAGDKFAYPNALSDVDKSSLDTDFIFLGWKRMRKNGIKLDHYLPVASLSLYTMFYKGNCVCHQATFTRLSVLKELQGYDENMKISSDICFLMKALTYHSKTYKIVPLYITIFDITGTSGSKEGNRIINEEKPKWFKQTFPYVYDDYVLLHRFLRFTPRNILNYLKWKLSLD